MSTTKTARRQVQVDGGILMAIYLSTLVSNRKIGRDAYTTGAGHPCCAVGHIRSLERGILSHRVYKETNVFGQAVGRGSACSLEHVSDIAVKRRKKGALTFEQWVSAVESTYNVELVPV